MVRAGGESQEPISELGCNPGVIQGEFFDIVIEIIELFLGVRLEKLVKLKYLIGLFVDL